MKRVLFLVALLTFALALMACGGAAAPADPQRIEVPVEVTVIVEGTPQIKEMIVTATPEPEKEVTFESPDPDTLTIATIGDAETFDPALNYESAGADIIQNTYEPLVTYDRDDATQLVGQLASEWKVSDDGLQYTFTIREGVMFHEGGELTTEDVAYSFQRALLQGGPASPMLLFTEPLLGVGIYDVAELIDPALSGDPDGLKQADATALADICATVQKSVVANDDGTVTFTLAQPWAPFLSTLAGGWGSIVDMEWMMENGAWDGDCATWQNFYGITSEADPFTSIINGTGPYKLENWTPGEQIVLVANENYWRTEDVGPAWEGGPVGAPAIERIVFQSVDEWGTRFAMMQAGDADFTVVPRENISQIDPLVGERCEYNAETVDFDCAATETPDAPLRLFIGQPGVSRTDAMFVFDINVEGGNPFVGSGALDGNGIPANFFSDIHVRKGFNYCFDWDSFIADALAGEAVQNVGPIIPNMLGYNPDGPFYSYDPDKCAEELATAWEGKLPETGFRMQVAYNTGNTTRQIIAEILQNSLATVNEKYVLETIGLPWPNFLRQIRESRLPLYISGWAEDIHDPHNWVQPFLAGTYATRQVFPEDLLATFKERVDAGVLATDTEERQAIYEELTQLDYDNAVAIRLATATGRHYEQRWVKGWYYNPAYSNFYYYSLTEK